VIERTLAVGTLDEVVLLTVLVVVGVAVETVPVDEDVAVLLLLLPLLNCHQSMLNKLSPALPVKRRNKSCVPVAPLIGHVTVAQVDQLPVPATVQVPTSVPVALPRRTSILPPELAEETRAEKDWAPLVPNATPRILT
jgi:hypothetical protein